MLFVYVLVILLVVLLGFSLSREEGKNTKFARKCEDVIERHEHNAQSINSSSVIEIN